MDLHFLYEEFKDFCLKFETKISEIENDRVSIICVGPPLALEQLDDSFNDFKVKKGRILGFKYLLMSSCYEQFIASKKDLMSLPIEKIKSVKIRYKKLYLLPKENTENEFRMQFLTKFISLDAVNYLNLTKNPFTYTFKKIEPNTNFQINSVDNFDIIRKNSFKNILISINFTHLHLTDVNLEKQIFWMNIFPINLNPITLNTVKYFGDLNGFHAKSLNNTIIIPKRRYFENLISVSYNKFDNFKVHETADYSDSDSICLNWPKLNFKRKCVLNADALNRDLILEHLQSKNWLLFERLEGYLKGLEVFQVCKKCITVIIPIQNMIEGLRYLKIQFSKKNVKARVILELNNFRQVLEFSQEIISLRYLVDDVYISESIEETILYLEKMAGSFEFRSEQTMLERFMTEYHGNPVVAQESLQKTSDIREIVSTRTHPDE